ncbi:unnamed protein product [Calypogeia fissa]
MVGEKELALMKKSALFVNTSRGPLVDERAPPGGRVRDDRSHVLLSPHLGYVEEQTLNNWYDEQAEIIERWHQGRELLNVLA